MRHTFEGCCRGLLSSLVVCVAWAGGGVVLAWAGCATLLDIGCCSEPLFGGVIATAAGGIFNGFIWRRR